MKQLRIYYFLQLVILFSFPIDSIGAGAIDSLVERLQKEDIEDTVKAKIYFDMSKEYFEEGNFISSLSYSDKSENIYKDLNLNTRVAEILYFKSEIFAEVNDFEGAIQDLHKAIEIYVEIKDSFHIFQGRVRLSSMNARIGNIDKSKQLISKSLLYFERIKDNHMLQETYYQYGILYGIQSELDSALIYLMKAKKILLSDDIGNKLELGGLLNNIGAIYSKKNNFDKALASYKKAISVFEKSNNKKGVGVSLSNIAFLYHKFQMLEQAESYYQQSSEILTEEGDIFYLSTIYSNWSDLFESKKDYENAYKMHLKYSSLQDSISGVEVMTRIAEMEKQFELKKKDQELDYLEKENLIKRNRQYLLIAIIVLILIVAFLIYRNLKVNVKNSRLKSKILANEKKELSEELDYKGKEVEDLALRIIEKNRFLQNLKDEVGEIDGIGENKGKIKNVSSHIRDNLYIDQDRKEFELQLDEIHKTFLFRLEKQYSNLSKSDKRLSTLLVMDLTTKDIATILNLSIAGVKTARYRLRKKINLDSKIDLGTHFKSI